LFPQRVQKAGQGHRQGAIGRRSFGDEGQARGRDPASTFRSDWRVTKVSNRSTIADHARHRTLLLARWFARPIAFTL
jgi:hypothetical protein